MKMRGIARGTTAAIVLAAAGVAVPCAAHAAFTATGSAAMPVSTLSLAAPQGAFSADCIRDATGPFHTLTLTVAMGAVKGATGYQVVLSGPSGERVTESFEKGDALVISVKKKGDWTYAVRVIHAATATNVWTGPLTAPRMVTCDKS